MFTVRGTFDGVRGTIHLPDGDIGRASVHVEVALESVRTGIGIRDRHLRGPHFFDAAQHRTATFRGGSILRWPVHWSLPGSLTLRGVTWTEELLCHIEDASGRGRRGGAGGGAGG